MRTSVDLIVFGATGFTGRLVAEYLNATYGVDGDLAWAIAGRNLDKLAQVRDRIGAATALPLLIADASDAASLAALVAQARVIITTVGPYQLYGQRLVRACVQAGTDYVDLCGEPGWLAQMIPLLDAPARTSGARVVFSCGFDSIPFDLGVVFLQEEALQAFRDTPEADDALWRGRLDWCVLGSCGDDRWFRCENSTRKRASGGVSLAYWSNDRARGLLIATRGQIPEKAGQIGRQRIFDGLLARLQENAS